MQQVQLLITLTQAGQVQVTGPIGDKILCYGLLEMARDAIREAVVEQGPQIIISNQMPGGDGHAR